MKRSGIYHHYWTASARELERKYLRNSVKTLARGRCLARGDEIVVDDGIEPEHIKMEGPAKYKVKKDLRVYNLVLSVSTL